MFERRRIRWIALVGGAFLTASAPVTVSVQEGIRTQAAACQNGTCCPEEKATCVVGDHQVGNYYHKASGSCIDQT